MKGPFISKRPHLEFQRLEFEVFLFRDVIEA
jgi:hypothetical protein